MNIDLLTPNISVETKNVFYLTSIKNYKNLPLAENEIQYLIEQVENESSLIEINQYTRKVFVHVNSKEELEYKDYEKMRKLGNSLHSKVQESKISELAVVDFSMSKELTLPILEGLSLSNYQFIRYLRETKK